MCLLHEGAPCARRARETGRSRRCMRCGEKKCGPSELLAAAKQRGKMTLIGSPSDASCLLTCTILMAANDSDTAHNSLASDLGGVGLSNLYGVIDRDK